MAQTRTNKEYIDFYKNLFTKENNEVSFEREIEKYFDGCDFYQFDYEDLPLIGFRRWEEESSLLLFPKYYYLCIPDGTKVFTIGDEYEYFKKGVTDRDYRFGCLGYGILKEDLEKVKEERRNENIDNIDKEN